MRVKDDGPASSFRVDRFAQPSSLGALGVGIRAGLDRDRFMCVHFRSDGDQAASSGPSVNGGHGFFPSAGRHHVHSGADGAVSSLIDLFGRASRFDFHNGRSRHCGGDTGSLLDRRIARELAAIVSALRIHSDAGLGAPLRRHSNLAVRRTGLSGNFSY